MVSEIGDARLQLLYTCRPSGALGDLDCSYSIHISPRWGLCWLIELMNSIHCAPLERINYSIAIL